MLAHVRLKGNKNAAGMQRNFYISEVLGSNTA